jgi:hypothetical protein
MIFSHVMSDRSSFRIKVGAATEKLLSPVVFFEFNVGEAGLMSFSH